MWNRGCSLLHHSCNKVPGWLNCILSFFPHGVLEWSGVGTDSSILPLVGVGTPGILVSCIFQL